MNFILISNLIKQVNIQTFILGGFILGEFMPGWIKNGKNYYTRESITY